MGAWLKRRWAAYLRLVREPDRCEHGSPPCADCGGRAPGEW